MARRLPYATVMVGRLAASTVRQDLIRVQISLSSAGNLGVIPPSVLFTMAARNAWRVSKCILSQTPTSGLAILDWGQLGQTLVKEHTLPRPWCIQMPKRRPLDFAHLYCESFPDFCNTPCHKSAFQHWSPRRTLSKDRNRRQAPFELHDRR